MVVAHTAENIRLTPETACLNPFIFRKKTLMYVNYLKDARNGPFKKLVQLSFFLNASRAKCKARSSDFAWTTQPKNVWERRRASENVVGEKSLLQLQLLLLHGSNFNNRVVAAAVVSKTPKTSFLWIVLHCGYTREKERERECVKTDNDNFYRKVASVVSKILLIRESVLISYNRIIDRWCQRWKPT